MAESETHYQRPVHGEMTGVATIDPADLEQMLSDLKISPKGRIDVEMQLISENEPCVTMTAQYVVLSK